GHVAADGGHGEADDHDIDQPADDQDGRRGGQGRALGEQGQQDADADQGGDGQQTDDLDRNVLLGAVKNLAVGAFFLGGQGRGQAGDQGLGQFEQGPKGGDADDAGADEADLPGPDGHGQFLGRGAGGQAGGDRGNAVSGGPGHELGRGQDGHEDQPGQNEA